MPIAKVDIDSYHLKSQADVINYLRRLDPGTEVLFESLDKQLNVLITVINGNVWCGFGDGHAGTTELKLGKAISLNYKPLSSLDASHKAELRKARHSFGTEWIRVDNLTLINLVTTLTKLTSHLPISSRFNESFAQGYIVIA